MPTLKLLATLGLDKTGFDAGLAAANKQVVKFGAGLKSQLAGAFGAAAVTAFVKEIISMGGEIKDLSDRLGVSAKDVQEFGLAAKLGGQNADVFARALEKIRLAMAKGDNPLAAFGVTMKEMQSGDAVGVLRKLAVGLEGFSGSAEKTKALAEAFGSRGMGAVVNMLRELQNVGKEPFLTEHQVELLDRAGDSLTRIWNRMRVIGASLIVHPENPLQRNASFSKTTVNEAIPEISDEEVEKQAKVAKEAADVQLKLDAQLERNRIAQMTDEERVNDLYAQRVELVRQLQFALTKEAQAEIQLKIAQNAGDIIGMQRKAGNVQRSGVGGIEESSFGRMGAFTGAAASASMPQQRQADLLNQIHQALVSRGIVVRDVAR